MHPAMMDYDGVPLSTQPYLLECDVDLVKEALYSILHPVAENSDTPPESIQIADALNKYIEECNNAFLASERIRLFLLLSLLVSLTISLIALATLPVSTVSVTLICIVSLILFSVNVFTLFHQMSGYQQAIDWNKLKTHCSEYTKKLYSKQKISSPTSISCLFSAKKIPLNDALHNNINNYRLNDAEERLSSIDEDSYEASVESNGHRPLISLT